VIRCVIGDGYFTQQELQVFLSSYKLYDINKKPCRLQELLSLIREEILSQKKHIPERHDPSLQPYEAYKVDFDYFKILFAALSPWGKGENAESLAASIFSVSFF
jgi:hypothetical protein